MSLKFNVVLFFSAIILFVGQSNFAQNSTIPGELTTPYPTIHNLAIEWIIQGDENLNGEVSLNYREKGEKLWKEGMPLRRVPAGSSKGTTPIYKWKNKHAGSLFDLVPGTTYELKLNLKDPDGGSVEKTVEAQTRPIPEYDSRAEIIEIAPGNYDTLVCRGGTEAHPLVYRCSAGTATFVHIDLQNRKWVFIEGLTVDNPFKKGFGIRFDGASNCVIWHCKVNAVYGIVAYKPGAENCYISDNIVTGTSSWTNKAMGAHGANIGEGIEITGPGNVICYNRVTGFRDCISTMEDLRVVNQTCIDIYNNDVYNGVDDAIEADFCFSNCRIYRNRITNSFVGLSSQPSLGGPTYFFRNVMYNVVHAAFKLKRYSHGDVVLHNTIVKVGAGLGGNDIMDYAFFRNNLAIGGPTGGVIWGEYGAGMPWAADIIGPGIHSSFDHDAVGVFEVPYIAKIGGVPFSDVEKNGIEGITLSETFTDVEFPNPPVPEREVQDLRPKEGSRVIDAGVFLPNMNDDFRGAAPDCGAYEAGQELPHYGPRLKAKQSAQYRPSLFFREDWKETPAELPVNQRHVSNSNLKLGLYGSAEDGMKKSNHDHPDDDPFYVWSGQCQGKWAATFKHSGSLVDLSEFATITWRSKQSGFRSLHIVLRLEDGSWLVSDQAVGSSGDWRISEFIVSDIQWYSLDIKSITEGKPVADPDLSRVDEVGFTDLMSGGQSSACSRLDWIEVYGKAVKR